MNVKTKPVTVVITCSIKPGKLEGAKRALAAVIQTVLEKEGACKGIQVHEDPAHPQRLLIIEYWDSQEVFTGPI